MEHMTSRCFAEFLGTFTLVLATCGAIVVNLATGAFDGSPGALGTLGISLVGGISLMVVICAFGNDSGAHCNPAVTFAFWWSGRFSGHEVLPYITCQICGAVIASLTLRLGFMSHIPYSTWGLTEPHPEAGIWLTFGFETLLTFLLMMIILRVASGSKIQGPLAALAVGGTVTMFTLILMPISGASFNPARSLGPALAHLHFDNQWIYILAPILGASLSVLTQPRRDC
jgi:aquaporin NIP